jgi:hypothetical protein
MSDCKETALSLVKPSEFVKNMVPFCDFYRPGHSYNGELVYHEVYSSKLEFYYKCINCPAHICADCHILDTSHVCFVLRSEFSTINKFFKFISFKYLNSYKYLIYNKLIKLNITIIEVLIYLVFFIIIFASFNYVCQDTYDVIYCTGPEKASNMFRESIEKSASTTGLNFTNIDSILEQNRVKLEEYNNTRLNKTKEEIMVNLLSLNIKNSVFLNTYIDSYVEMSRTIYKASLKPE